MNRQPLTQIELFKKLQELKPKFDVFKETDSASLNAEEVELMKDLYDDVKVFSHGQVALSLQGGCASCIREAFQVFISLYDRLAADPFVNPEAESLEAFEPDVEDFTSDEVKLDVSQDVIDQAKAETLAELNAEPAPLQEPTPETTQHSEAIEADLAKKDLFEPVPFEPQAATQDHIDEIKSQEPVTVQPAAELPQVVEPAAVVNEAPVEGLPLNTPETLTPQQKGAITKKANAMKEATAKKVESPDKPE